MTEKEKAHEVLAATIAIGEAIHAAIAHGKDSERLAAIETALEAARLLRTKL